MLQKLLHTRNDMSLAVLRLAMGVVFFAHGAQKMLGWFGGYGFSGTMGFFTQNLHIPSVFALLAIAAEFFGGLGLIVGFLGRIAAFGIATNMLVAVLMIHHKFGFFMNWTGKQAGEGMEYFLLAIAAAVVVLVQGSGALSVDGALTRPAPAPVPGLRRAA